MTDCEYLFRQTSKERKDVARSAKYKKNGSKSKKCTLPSDYLSKKEILKMSSAPVTWSMNSFYSYPQFKSMPDDIKVEYINHICGKYKIGLATVSRTMFNLSDTALRMYLDGRGLLKGIRTNCHGRSGYKGEYALREDMQKALSDPIRKLDMPQVAVNEDPPHGFAIEFNGIDVGAIEVLKKYYENVPVKMIITIEVV